LVALDYLDALRAQGDYKAAEANLKLSRKLMDQAQDQFQSGLPIALMWPGHRRVWPKMNLKWPIAEQVCMMPILNCSAAQAFPMMVF